MGQRLGIAAALLGDPGIVLLDEPVNGLDPEGIQWVRGLLRALAAEGRTVFVSSHLMAEMAVTADHLIIIGQGRLIADATVAEVISGSANNHVVVRSPDLDKLHGVLRDRATAIQREGDALIVSGLECKDVGVLAAAASVTLYELSPRQASLEEAFMEMTRDSAEFRTESATPTPAGLR
jgi:ABC-2 type transport system ATP-binding protein